MIKAALKVLGSASLGICVPAQAQEMSDELMDLAVETAMCTETAALNLDDRQTSVETIARISMTSTCSDELAAFRELFRIEGAEMLRRYDALRESDRRELIAEGLQGFEQTIIDGAIRRLLEARASQ